MAPSCPLAVLRQQTSYSEMTAPKTRVEVLAVTSHRGYVRRVRGQGVLGENDPEVDVKTSPCPVAVLWRMAWSSALLMPTRGLASSLDVTAPTVTTSSELTTPR